MAKKGTPGSSHDAPAVTRSGFLRGAIQSFLDFHKLWQDDENAPNPPDAYWDHAASVVEAFKDGDIPEDCRGLVEPVEKFRVEAKVFDERSDAGRLYPHDKFWVAIDGLAKAIKGVEPPKPKPPLESMRALVEQKVSVRQIAVMWSCTEAEVEAELAKPGSICTPSFCAAAEAARDRPTTKDGIRERAPVDLREVASLLEGETPVADVIELTGADAATVANVARKLRSQGAQPVNSGA